MAKVKPSDVGAEIMRMLDQYSDDVAEQIRDTTKALLKDARAEVSTKSPRRTGAYARGWAVDLTNGANYVQGRVYNRDRYRLTHLLEKPHLIRNGTGRTYGTLNPKPPEGHIGVVNDRVQKELEDAIKEIIANG